MRSSFFEFNVAKSALFTARGNMEVSYHNIANRNSEGYSRQYAMQRASRPMPENNGRGMVGTGSEVYGIGQIRDFYLDRKYWGHSSTLGEYTVKETQLTTLEELINELSGTGLTKSFNNFFEELQNLSTTTSDEVFRSNVLQVGQVLSDFVNTLGTELRNQQLDVNEEVRAVVAEISSLGRQISSLNKQIYTYEMDGSHANDLRDQRALLVDKLSVYINVDVTEAKKGYVIQANGHILVDQFDTYNLEVHSRTAAGTQTPEEVLYNPSDAAYLYDIYFENSDIKFNIYDSKLRGELKGLIDIRDGNGGENRPTYTNPDGTPGTPKSTTLFKGVPYYLNRLNELVRTFARAVDEGKNADGELLGGDADNNGISDDVIGILNGADAYGNVGKNRFFVYDGFESDDPFSFDYDELDCFNFSVNQKLIDDPKLLACEDTNDKGESNNKVILSLLKLPEDKTLFSQGKLEDYLLRITGDLAISMSQADRFEKSYYDVVGAVQIQRISVSGVDENEEFAALIQYQNLYQAASKLVTIIDNIYQTTINLGL